MSSEQLIPNAVGRLDDVVEAIRDGRIEDVSRLLKSEGKRLSEKVETIEGDLSRAIRARNSVQSIIDLIEEVYGNESPGEDAIEDWNKIREACGGGVEVKNDE